jgi:hypothetical protein
MDGGARLDCLTDDGDTAELRAQHDGNHEIMGIIADARQQRQRWASRHAWVTLVALQNSPSVSGF